MQNMAKIDYTFAPQWAIGTTDTYYQQDHYSTHGLDLTHGWRWNHPDSQTNVYVWGGGGAALVDHTTKPSGWGGASVDWEDRRFFTEAGFSGQKTINGPDYLWQTGRVGIAPYIAEAGQLHTWLMVQADHTPGAKQTWSATPLIRQFYGSNLWEGGVSTRGGVLVNFMKSF
jgi:hypothetical protein